jgi:prepilin-type N-terminal cleavage/methylation domain-containing protein
MHMNSRSARPAGFTLVEIMIVVAIIGLLCAIAIPNLVRARTQSQMNSCINNMRQIDDAIQAWALEHNQRASAAVSFQDIRPYLKNEVICPAGGTSFADSYYMCHIDHTVGFSGSWAGFTSHVHCLVSPNDHVLPADTTE